MHTVCHSVGGQYRRAAANVTCMLCSLLTQTPGHRPHRRSATTERRRCIRANGPAWPATAVNIGRRRGRSSGGSTARPRCRRAQFSCWQGHGRSLTQPQPHCRHCVPSRSTQHAFAGAQRVGHATARRQRFARNLSSRKKKRTAESSTAGRRGCASNVAILGCTGSGRCRQRLRRGHEWLVNEAISHTQSAYENFIRACAPWGLSASLRET